MRKHQEGGIPIGIGIVILLLIIFAGIVLGYMLGGGSGQPSCEAVRDACVTNCGTDILCEQNCEADFTVCIERRVPQGSVIQ